MNDTELEWRLEQLETQLGDLQSAEQQRGAMERKRISWGIRDSAKLLALRSMVQELAVRAGVSPERADSTFQERVRYFLDCLHQMSEKRDQGAAAQIDDRSPGEIPTDEGFPSLFDDAED